MPYDEESGLVYNETFVPARRTQCRYLYKHRRPEAVHREPLYNAKPKTHGAPSLVNMVKRNLQRNLHLLDAVHLDALPELLTKQWWSEVKLASADSLHAWQIFAQTGHFDREFTKTLEPKCRLCGLGHIKDAAICPNPSPVQEWITNLELGNAPCTVDELISLSQIRNLHTLHIRGFNARVPFSDRVIREWAHEAGKGKAFLKLEMMFIDNIPEITPLSLNHLNAFPKLDTFCVRDCSFTKKGANDFLGIDSRGMSKHGMSLGWVSGTRSTFQCYTRPLEPGGCDESAGRFLGPTTRFWENLVRSFVAHRCDSRPRDKAQNPILNIHVQSVNSDRLRSDDFGTRIWCFERDWSFQAPPTQLLERPQKKRKLDKGKAKACRDLLHGIL